MTLKRRDFLVDGQSTFSKKFIDACNQQHQYQVNLDQRLSVPKHQRQKVESYERSVRPAIIGLQESQQSKGKKRNYRNLIQLFSQGIQEKALLKEEVARRVRDVQGER